MSVPAITAMRDFAAHLDQRVTPHGVVWADMEAPSQTRAVANLRQTLRGEA